MIFQLLKSETGQRQCKGGMFMWKIRRFQRKSNKYKIKKYSENKHLTSKIWIYYFFFFFLCGGSSSSGCITTAPASRKLDRLHQKPCFQTPRPRYAYSSSGDELRVWEIKGEQSNSNPPGSDRPIPFHSKRPYCSSF